MTCLVAYTPVASAFFYTISIRGRTGGRTGVRRRLSSLRGVALTDHAVLGLRSRAV